MNDTTRWPRHGRHRDEIIELLRGATEFLSAQAVYAELRLRDVPIGLTTVYRTLQTLAHEGAVDAVRTSTGEQVYRKCSPGQHHHLMCRLCARAIEVEGPSIEQWASAVAADHGFRDINHSVEIFGICEACAARR